jgi:hypothetical protein
MRRGRRLSAVLVQASLARPVKNDPTWVWTIRASSRILHFSQLQHFHHLSHNPHCDHFHTSVPRYVKLKITVDILDTGEYHDGHAAHETKPGSLIRVGVEVLNEDDLCAALNGGWCLLPQAASKCLAIGGMTM